jgi:hypothetical protein
MQKTEEQETRKSNHYLQTSNTNSHIVPDPPPPPHTLCDVVNLITHTLFCRSDSLSLSPSLSSTLFRRRGFFFVSTHISFFTALTKERVCVCFISRFLSQQTRE